MFVRGEFKVFIVRPRESSEVRTGVFWSTYWSLLKCVLESSEVRTGVFWSAYWSLLKCLLRVLYWAPWMDLLLKSMFKILLLLLLYFISIIIRIFIIIFILKIPGTGERKFSEWRKAEQNRSGADTRRSTADWGRCNINLES